MNFTVLMLLQLTWMLPSFHALSYEEARDSPPSGKPHFQNRRAKDTCFHCAHHWQIHLVKNLHDTLCIHKLLNFAYVFLGISHF